MLRVVRRVRILSILFALTSWVAVAQHSITSGVEDGPPVDDPPSIFGIGNLSLFLGEGPLTLYLFVADDITPARDVKVSALVANPGLILPSLGPPDTSGMVRKLFLEPVAGRVGSTAITLVADDGRKVRVSSFVVTIRPALMQRTTKLAELSGRSGPMAWGDSDQDGQMDLFLGIQPLVENPSTYGRLLRNQDGQFVETNLSITNFLPTIAVWGDSDN